MSQFDTIRGIEKFLRKRFDARTRRACIYLQRRGFRFFCDFGYGNAKQLARDVRAGRVPVRKLSSEART